MFILAKEKYGDSALRPSKEETVSSRLRANASEFVSKSAIEPSTSLRPTAEPFNMGPSFPGAMGPPMQSMWSQQYTYVGYDGPPNRRFPPMGPMNQFMGNYPKSNPPPSGPWSGQI